jgi:hypothetical protein
MALELCAPCAAVSYFAVAPVPVGAVRTHDVLAELSGRIRTSFIPTVTSRRARVVRPRDDGVMIRRRCGFGAARQRSSEAAAQEARRSRAESAEIRHCRPSPARSRASLRIAARRAEGGGPAGGRPRPRSCWGGSRRHQLGSLDSLPRASDRHLPPFRDRFLTAEVDRFPDQADWCGRQRAIVHQRDGSYVDEDANEPQ